MKLQAVFLDRDGTLGDGASAERPSDFRLYPFAPQALELLRGAGLKLFAFTNQSGIARGPAAGYDFLAEFQGYGLHGMYLCPHRPEDGCNCRKPKPGMLWQAQRDHGLQLSRCVVVGDRWSDLVAARTARCLAVLVKTGAGLEALGPYRHKWAGKEADYVAEDVLDASRWIVEQTRDL